MSGQSFLTIHNPATAEMTIERSRFIGHCETAADENAAKAFVAQIRAAHAQASHNCYAYRIGAAEFPLEYWHDHGEPSGTAGKPILGSIQRLGLTNVVVVVTRYFGGKKLGVRGLIEAYAATASLVLEQAGSFLKIPQFQVVLEYNYPEHDQILYQFRQIGAVALESSFAATVVTRFQIPEEKRNLLQELSTSLPFIRILSEVKES